MGFISKEQADALLLQERPGTFLVRFSSQAAGSFAIAYHAPGGGVCHYLIRKPDVNQARSLALFLTEKDFFQTLLQTIPSFDTEPQWARFGRLPSTAPNSFYSRTFSRQMQGVD